MEELTGKKISKGDMNKLRNLVINEYESPDSAAFAKNASTVRKVVLKKFPMHKRLLKNEVVKKILGTSSVVYHSVFHLNRKPVRELPSDRTGKKRK